MAAETAGDDRSRIVIPWILEQLKRHRRASFSPFFIGLNGVQGIGKTTLVTNLAQALRAPPHCLPTLTLSIDDLYLPHAAQAALAKQHPCNALIQHRGQPSTHDLPLATQLFSALATRAHNIAIPAYDKSLHAGAGDRLPPAQWHTVNAGAPEDEIQVVIFEGWCVGFRALGVAALRAKWTRATTAAAASAARGEQPMGRLGVQRFEDVEFVDDALAAYADLTRRLDALVYLDAQEPGFVYGWRLEAERALRRDRGAGMSDERVREFVDGYFSSYELYAEELRRGLSRGEAGMVAQLNITIGRGREVLESEAIGSRAS